MPQPSGRCVRMSPPRRFISDLVHFSSRAPLTTMQRTMRLADVADARLAGPSRIGWCALFVKAYAITAARTPPLRWAYIPWPWPHFYEHPWSIASVAVERRWEDEDAVFFAHIRNPPEQTLTALQEHLDRFKIDPVESIALFRRILQTSRVPGPLRRLLWWTAMDFSGRRRAHYLGTFGVSVTGGLGASSLDLLTPVTTALNYGVVADDGTVDVRLTYDHRVLDGGTAARALADTEAALHGPVLEELEEMGRGETQGILSRGRPNPRT